ncbi:hypothetical protein ABZ249_07210 [Nocardiopsis sp. NPDC006139]|uniref:hypothetical protein n=1 Tax=unclassified Nocardiopsis TaxID=2649073 RepID=UPI0033A7F458
MTGTEWGDEELFDELLHRLSPGDRAAIASPDRTTVLLDGGDGGKPFILHVDPAALGVRLRTTAREAQEVFPDAEPLIAALRLFLVHVDEAVDTAPPDHRHLALEPGGVRAHRVWA